MTASAPWQDFAQAEGCCASGFIERNPNRHAKFNRERRTAQMKAVRYRAAGLSAPVCDPPADAFMSPAVHSRSTFRDCRAHTRRANPRKTSGNQRLSKMRAAGGERGIRTLGTLARSTVFETAPFDHSGTSPRGPALNTSGRTKSRESRWQKPARGEPSGTSPRGPAPNTRGRTKSRETHWQMPARGAPPAEGGHAILPKSHAARDCAT